jgi:ribosomal protein S18 acetylase RimI-like enzyme
VATSQGAPNIGLWVTDGNDTARIMYQRLGFKFTGEWAPLPHDAATGEHRMRIVLGRGGA